MPGFLFLFGLLPLSLGGDRKRKPGEKEGGKEGGMCALHTEGDKLWKVSQCELSSGRLRATDRRARRAVNELGRTVEPPWHNKGDRAEKERRESGLTQRLPVGSISSLRSWFPVLLRAGIDGCVRGVKEHASLSLSVWKAEVWKLKFSGLHLYSPGVGRAGSHLFFLLLFSHLQLTSLQC